MPQASQSLKHRQLPLADANFQRQTLQRFDSPGFDEVLRAHSVSALKAAALSVLQVNVGKLCNMTCRHCHVDAGPDRREIMTRETVDECLAAIERTGVQTLDLTGGAPEMNPSFRHFVETARGLGIHVIDRCNLTILQARGYEGLAEFLAEHQVEVVASLPCYLESNTDQQRGAGAYQSSIDALTRLNQLGYGDADRTGLRLTLVYNPVGPVLPPDQIELERAYREFLRGEFGLEFDRLFTITNMPISRFLEDLLESGAYESYMETLVSAFNPSAIDGLMCRNTISVSWDGRLFDCDFNQMLELPVADALPQHISQLRAEDFEHRAIATGLHCFGCTAGQGSSCQGAIDA